MADSHSQQFPTARQMVVPTNHPSTTDSVSASGVSVGPTHVQTGTLHTHKHKRRAPRPPMSPTQHVERSIESVSQRGRVGDIFMAHGHSLHHQGYTAPYIQYVDLTSLDHTLASSVPPPTMHGSGIMPDTAYITKALGKQLNSTDGNWTLRGTKKNERPSLSLFARNMEMSQQMEPNIESSTNPSSREEDASQRPGYARAYSYGGEVDATVNHGNQTLTHAGQMYRSPQIIVTRTSEISKVMPHRGAQQIVYPRDFSSNQKASPVFPIQGTLQRIYGRKIARTPSQASHFSVNTSPQNRAPVVYISKSNSMGNLLDQIPPTPNKSSVSRFTYPKVQTLSQNPRQHLPSASSTINYHSATVPRNMGATKNIYHGEMVRVKVPRYVVPETYDLGRDKLWEAKQRYHSEPNLLESGNKSDAEEFAKSQDDLHVRDSLSVSRENAPRSVVLQKGRNGFGFVLRGAKSQAASSTSTLDFSPTTDFPALQYLDRVDKGSMADRAGLKPGDFLLEINGENVVNATHEHTVQLIKSSGDTLAMKVVTVKPLSCEGMEREVHMDGTRTLPLKKKGLDLVDTPASSHLTDQQLNAAALRHGVDPNNKTASIRSRHSKRLVAVELEHIFAGENSGEPSLSSVGKSSGCGAPRTYTSAAQMKRAANGRAANSVNNLVRARSSPSLAEKGMAVTDTESTYAKHIATISLGKEHSTPGGNVHTAVADVHHYSSNQNTPTSGDIERDRLYARPNKGPQQYDSAKMLKDGHEAARSSANQSVSLDPHFVPPHPREPPPLPPEQERNMVIPPPPSHSPPIPPIRPTKPTHGVGEMVPITPAYANISAQIQAEKNIRGTRSDIGPVESSFRPGKGARLSKEPALLPSSQRTHSRTPSMSSSSSHLSQNSHQSDNQSAVAVSGNQNIDHQDQKKTKMHSDDLNSAVQFTKDIPHANVLVTADLATAKQKQPSNETTHEPMPDYDQEEYVESESIQSVKEMSEIEDNSSGFTSGESSGKFSISLEKGDKETMSNFGNAIKMAALAREKRSQENRIINTDEPERLLQKVKQVAPPPPPSGPTHALSLHRSSVTSTSPQGQKRFEASRKHDDSHAQLMAAVARRRNIVEASDQTELANNIEERVTRAKKMQSTMYHSDQTKEDLVNQPKPIAPLLFKKGDQHVKKSVNELKIVSKSSSTSLEEGQNNEENGQTDFLAMAEKARQDWLLKRAASNAATLERKPVQQRLMHGTTSQSGMQSNTLSEPPPPPPPPPPETTRNQPSRKFNDHPSPKPPTHQIFQQDQSPGLGNLASIIAQKALQRQQSADNVIDGFQPNPSSENKGSEGTHRSTDSMQVSKLSQGSMHTVFDSRKQNLQPNGKLNHLRNMEIKGATVDYSNTEGQSKDNDDERSKSVAAKAKLFESQFSCVEQNSMLAGKKSTSHLNNSKNKLPFTLPPPEFNESLRNPVINDEAPPPMIPPPPTGFTTGADFKSGSAKEINEPVGWVINSNPAHMTHEYAIRSKLSQDNQIGRHNTHNNESGQVHQMLLTHDTVSDTAVTNVMEIEVIPPPPFFETHETLPVLPVPFSNMHGMNANSHDDNSSMVSSLSTLSTLSSCEHESSLHDSPRHSIYGRYDLQHQTHFPILEEKGGEDIYQDIAPPPPGFDDALGGPAPHNDAETDHTYEELPALDHFLPPPSEFNITPSPVAPSPETHGPVTSLRNALKSNQIPARLTFRNKEVNSWTPADVGDWLDSLQLGQHRDSFLQHVVNGPRLCTLERNELISLGVTQVGDRMSLERAIRRLTLN